MKYTCILELDLGECSTSVAELLNSLNESMHGFGFSENLVIDSEMPFATLTVAREFTPGEMTKATAILWDCCKNIKGSIGVRIE